VTDLCTNEAPRVNVGALEDSAFYASLTKTERALFDQMVSAPLATPEATAAAQCFRVHLSNIRKKIDKYNASVEIALVRRPTQYVVY
jgi:hypothetical protein